MPQWKGLGKYPSAHLRLGAADRSFVAPAPWGPDGGEAPVIDETTTLWVVLDQADQVVVIAAGVDAAGFAAEWADRGYRIAELRPDEVVAA